MPKLKLSAVPDDRPVKITVELPAAVHRDLVAYADVLGRQNGQKVSPQSSSRRCSHASCPQIERLQVHDEKRKTQADRVPVHPMHFYTHWVSES